MATGDIWQPTRIERVNRVLSTSTKPLLVETDAGTALVKYMGNPQGNDALVSELVAANLAERVGLLTPEFAAVYIPKIEVLDPFVDVHPGAAFFSRWEQAASLSPNSKLLAQLRTPKDVSRLVVFDTWIRNKDRFTGDPYAGNFNYDNILLKPDKRKTQLLVIDHSHAFAETTLEHEITENWSTEQNVYGLFNEFASMLTRHDVQSVLDSLCAIPIDEVRGICAAVPPEWGFGGALASRLADLLIERAHLMNTWFADAVFDQLEFDFNGKEA
ncbi:HipA family kinase [Hoeflea sp.]|uniref:HipA family kinase n=1 Tax=Hoeflea sp. TaxID=1940281 RepID=UPI003BB21183